MKNEDELFLEEARRVLGLWAEARCSTAEFVLSAGWLPVCSAGSEAGYAKVVCGVLQVVSNSSEALAFEVAQRSGLDRSFVFPPEGCLPRSEPRSAGRARKGPSGGSRKKGGVYYGVQNSV